MLTLTSLPSKVSNFFKSLKNFPAEVVLALVVFAGYVFLNHNRQFPYEKLITNIFILAPALFSVIFALRNGWYKKTQSTLSKWVYWFSPLLVVVVALLPGFEGERLVASLVLAVLLILSCRWHYDNRNFVADGVRLFDDIISSASISLLVAGAYYAIVLSVFYLFNLKDHFLQKIFFEDGGVFLLVVFFPLLFVYRDEQNKELSDELPAFLSLTITYILIPALLIYTVILYAYAAKILVAWNLPQGYVGWMVFAYICLAFAAYVVHATIKPNRLYQLFFKYFPFIAIVPLLLLAVGLYRRISDYGLTEDRIYLTTFGICVALFLIFLSVKRLNHYLLMVAVSAFAIIVLVYVPFLSAKHLSYVNQLGRVNAFIEKYDLLDASKAHFKADNDIPKAALCDTVNLRRFCSSYYYITGQENIRYSYKCKSDTLYGELPECIRSVYSFRCQTEKYYYTNLNRNVSIDVHLYPYMVSHISQQYGDFTVKSKEKTIYTLHMADFIKKHQKQLLAEDENDPDLFVVKNDSVMFVVEDFGFSHASDSIESLNMSGTLFAKHPYTDVTTRDIVIVTK